VSHVDGRQIVYRYDIGADRAEVLPIHTRRECGLLRQATGIHTRWETTWCFPHESGTQTIDYWSMIWSRLSLTQLTRLGLASMDQAVCHRRGSSLPRADGTVISALLWVPFNAARDGSSPAVLLAHGGPQADRRSASMPMRLRSHLEVTSVPGTQPSGVDRGYGRPLKKPIVAISAEVTSRTYVAGARFLAENGLCGFVPYRITGTSYGGFMTIMALGRAPGGVCCGCLRSVASQIGSRCTSVGHRHCGRIRSAHR